MARILSIPTRDVSGPRFPLFGADDAVRTATRRERGMTRDDVPLGEKAPRTEMVGNISYPEPAALYSLGTIWTGDDREPGFKEAQYAMQVLDRALRVRDQDFNAESVENVLSHLKVTAAQLESVLATLASADDACDIPPDGKTKDARPTRSGLFDTTRTAAYAENLKKRGQAPVAQSPPTTDRAVGMTRGQRAMFDASRTAAYAKNLAGKKRE